MIDVNEHYETLSGVLRRLGLAVQRVPLTGVRNIVEDGKVVFTGRVHETWDWLESSGRIRFAGERTPELDAIESFTCAVCAAVNGEWYRTDVGTP